MTLGEILPSDRTGGLDAEECSSRALSDGILCLRGGGGVSESESESMYDWRAGVGTGGRGGTVGWTVLTELVLAETMVTGAGVTVTIGVGIKTGDGGNGMAAGCGESAVTGEMTFGEGKS